MSEEELAREALAAEETEEAPRDNPWLAVLAVLVAVLIMLLLTRR